MLLSEKDDVVILDVRATGNYGSGHLKGSMSTPVFNANGVAKTTDDQLSKDFTKYVTDNKATLEKKNSIFSATVVQVVQEQLLLY